MCKSPLLVSALVWTKKHSNIYSNSIASHTYKSITKASDEKTTQLPKGNESILIVKDEIDLLFSDGVMSGGITGYELIEKITTQWTHIKTLLISDFTSKVKTKKPPSPYDENLISKPYRKAESAKHVRLKLNENKQ